VRVRQVCPAGLGILALALATDALAQVPSGRRELVGIVKDPRGVAIEGATVEIPGAGTRTDSRGMFRLFTGEVDTLTIAVRRPGYSPIEAQIAARSRQWDTLMIELEQLATSLPVARVEEEAVRRGGLRGFYERLDRRQPGLFITRDEIVARGASRLTDVLQTRKGIQVVRLSNTRNGVRFVTYSGTRGASCVPDMWVDGQRARGMEVDDLPPNTVEAMELYDTFAAVPFEFSHSANAVPCGTIIVWTRPPGTRKP
jgi:hypothetical protein